MTTSNNSGGNHPRFQFRLRTLLLITTTACVLLGVLLTVLPESLSIGSKIIIFVTYGVVIAYAARSVYNSKHRPWTLPAETLTVQVDAKWLRRAKSPLIMGPIAALTGVSVSFAPAYLLWCGQVEEFGILEWIGVPVCFLVIYIVPGFYMSLASEVLAQLMKSEVSDASS